jgi:multidrug resistance efflux pump
MPNAVGRVEAVRVNIAASADGTLVQVDGIPGGQWKPLDVVQRGQVVARLDDRALQALLGALRSDAAALKSELASTQAEMRLGHFDRAQEHFREASELAYQVERYRLDVLDQSALVEETRLELQRIDAQLAMLRTAYASGVGLQGESGDLTSDRTAMDKLLRVRQMALREAQKNLAAAVARQTTLPELEPLDAAPMLAPIQEQILAAEARVAEVAAQIDSLLIRSPVTGTVSAVYAHPGQGVSTGEWILTIAAEQAESIVGYVPVVNRFRPTEGMPVGVRLRIPGSRMVRSVVERVGTQFEPMPIELLADPQVPELALPVRIQIPDGLVVRPGELVDLRFFETTSGQMVRHVVEGHTLPVSASRNGESAPPSAQSEKGPM